MLSVSADFDTENICLADFDAGNVFSVFFPRKRDGKYLCFPPSFRIRFKSPEPTQIRKNANVNAINTICNLNLESNSPFKAEHSFIYTWWIRLVGGTHLQPKWTTTKYIWSRVTDIRWKTNVTLSTNGMAETKTIWYTTNKYCYPIVWQTRSWDGVAYLLSTVEATRA